MYTAFSKHIPSASTPSPESTSRDCDGADSVETDIVDTVLAAVTTPTELPALDEGKVRGGGGGRMRGEGGKVGGGGSLKVAKLEERLEGILGEEGGRGMVGGGARLGTLKAADDDDSAM
jgi:hypothetical protein